MSGMSRRESARTLAAVEPSPARADVPARALDQIAPGSTTGVGSLPHRNARDAAEFVFEVYDVPAIPHLPRRSPAESVITPALTGVRGVTYVQYGALAIDVDRLDPDAPIEVDLRSDNFVGLCTFLALAAERGYEGPITWQFVGPVSVGAALRRAGAAPEVAFEIASRAVRTSLCAISEAISAALPRCPQLVLLDEPSAAELTGRDFPIAPDEGVDLLSGAMAAIGSRATFGVHCCEGVDLALLLEAGPQVLSIPVSPTLGALAGYVDRFLRSGGWIAWGAAPTEGPIAASHHRAWQRLAALWRDLVEHGCDPGQLAGQSLLTPQCGLGSHSVSVAHGVCRSLQEVADRLRSEGPLAHRTLRS